MKCEYNVFILILILIKLLTFILILLYIIKNYYSVQKLFYSSIKNHLFIKFAYYLFDSYYKYLLINTYIINTNINTYYKYFTINRNYNSMI